MSDDGKTFDGIKTGGTRGRRQTLSAKKLKDVFVSVSDLLRRGLTAYRGYLSLFMVIPLLSPPVAS